VVDLLASEWGLTWQHSKSWHALWAKGEKAILLKPTSYMNRSGEPLAAVANFYKIAAAEILVVLDDFALDLGRLRLRSEGGTGGHNGLESIIIQFGTEAIPGCAFASVRRRLRARSTMSWVDSSMKSGRFSKKRLRARRTR
jgi:PTH1 family peptidyl-tRNA hydrolase